MSGRLFLIHRNDSEAEEHAGMLRSEGWSVDIEAQDGARAAKLIRDDPLDAVVVYLTRMPSHGRETARYLRSIKGRPVTSPSCSWMAGRRPLRGQ